MSNFLRREGHYIREMGTLNKIVAGRTLGEYLKENREDVLAGKKKYYEEHKEHSSRKQREYRETRRETLRAKGRHYYEKNKEAITRTREETHYKERCQDYYRANKDSILERRKETYECICGSICCVIGRARHERTQNI